MSRPIWWYSLQESRRQALVAIDFYNRAGDKRSFLDFVVHMHLAWQNLLHADLERRHQNIYFKESNGHYLRDKDGNKLSWDLGTCVRHEFSNASPVRANVEFFIGLRNNIEHRYQEALLAVTASHAHALVLNFEAELVDRFGQHESLADQLRFPVFIQSLTPHGVDDQRKLRRSIPTAARTYITEFEANLPIDVKEDTRYEYRVLLTPIKGPKTEADMAVTFVNAKTLTPQALAALRSNEKGTVLVAEKQRSVGLLDEMLPAAATRAIAARLPFQFTLSDFLRVRRALGVGPMKGQKGDAGDGVHCIYSAPTWQHVYTKTFVDLCVRELSKKGGYRALVGRDPRLRVA